MEVHWTIGVFEVWRGKTLKGDIKVYRWKVCANNSTAYWYVGSPSSYLGKKTHFTMLGNDFREASYFLIDHQGFLSERGRKWQWLRNLQSIDCPFTHKHSDSWIAARIYLLDIRPLRHPVWRPLQHLEYHGSSNSDLIFQIICHSLHSKTLESWSAPAKYLTFMQALYHFYLL